MNKWIIGIVTLVLVLAGIIYTIYQLNDYDFNDAEKSYEIVDTWELPSELNEVSGIVYEKNDLMICVQDEDGILFTYDMKARKIINQHKFSYAGDYEALTYLDGSYWIAESNGRLINVIDLDVADQEIEGTQLDFEYRNNIEGMAATSNNKLWITVKDRNLDNSSGYKGVYEYDPASNKLQREPVLKIDYEDPKFDRLKTHNPRKLLRPSDLAIHPTTGELYILDAEFQKIVVTNKQGTIKSIHLLDPAEFEQPEGIAFSSDGRIFISNERVGVPANIREIRFN
ncbi:SdiA-regulated domain-containing protein [Christiangramia portivictoriae]|uniref:SdiA-regulated domain-containing protein n=1 Tax=Christiangramia portivictoriae TaxID=326069 RepID=UPI00040560BF|nr:SdiA-regulated domain-containing protein [Christiangramia portivictoriae]